MFETLEVLRQIGGDPDPAGSALARAQHAERMQDLRDEREAEARRARRAENAEMMAIQNRALGDPLGQIRCAQEQSAELEAEAAGLRDRLAKVEGRLASARSNVQLWADRLLVADEASARSRVPDPLEAVQMRAADALREAHEGQMLLQRARRQVRQRSAGSGRYQPVTTSRGGYLYDKDDDEIRPVSYR